MGGTHKHTFIHLCFPPHAPDRSATTVEWTPESIAEMSMRWGIVGTDTSSKSIVHVSTRNCQVRAARVDGKKTSGWRIMQNQSQKVILYPTTAPHAKRHWLLSCEQSALGKSITWTRAGEIMKWVTLPCTTRVATLKKRADRLVKDLSPVVSPRKRKRGKAATAQNNGCCCKLEKCKQIRLEAGGRENRLPACEPRTARLPSTKPAYGIRDRRKRAQVSAQAYAQRRCLGLPPNAPARQRFSAVHFHPNYARDFPKVRVGLQLQWIHALVTHSLAHSWSNAHTHQGHGDKSSTSDGKSSQKVQHDHPLEPCHYSIRRSAQGFGDPKLLGSNSLSDSSI